MKRKRLAELVREEAGALEASPREAEALPAETPRPRSRKPGAPPPST
ncbi:hypothetical protein [Thermus tengchongensis]|nr:hypothetical protein [Thermus tengchongensis]